VFPNGLKLDLPKDKDIVKVFSTSNRGFTPEELAEQCVGQIVNVSDTAPPVIRDQAKAFAKSIESVIVQYMNVYNVLRDAGYPDLAEAVRRL
jgi:hypothetical protein